MTLLTAEARGLYMIAATPFAEDGGLDLPSIDRMVEFYLEAGAAGLTILGMMGEAPKLAASESAEVVRRVLARVAGRVPVIVGVSAPGFAAMGEITRLAMGEGAGGVMIAPPSTLRTDEQITGYYRAAAGAIGETPFVLQDFPLATGVQMSVSAITQIVAELPGCVCLKHEDWPGLEKISALRREGALARRISILCGNGGVFLPEEMLRGADGAMTGFAYPEMMVDVIRLIDRGEAERARDIFDAYLPLVRYEQQPGAGLAVRKYVMMKRGVIASDRQRLPGAPLSARARAEVDQLIARQTRRLADLGA